MKRFYAFILSFILMMTCNKFSLISNAARAGDYPLYFETEVISEYEIKVKICVSHIEDFEDYYDVSFNIEFSEPVLFHSVNVDIDNYKSRYGNKTSIIRQECGRDEYGNLYNKIKFFNRCKIISNGAIVEFIIDMRTCEGSLGIALTNIEYKHHGNGSYSKSNDVSIYITPPTISAPTGIASYGDFNFDGIIDSFDATIVLRYYLLHSIMETYPDSFYQYIQDTQS